MNRLSNKGHEVLGLDNYNNHLYDPQLKIDRTEYFGLNIQVCDLRDYEGMLRIIDSFQPEQIVHLAHAGVRDSFGKERDYHQTILTVHRI